MEDHKYGLLNKHYCYARVVNDIVVLLKKLNKREEIDYYFENFIICLDHFSRRLEGYLLSSYVDIEKNTLEMVDSKSILLRGCIESYILVNIFSQGDESVSKRFYQKQEVDTHYLNGLYNQNMIQRIHHNRFDFINDHHYPHSLSELIQHVSLSNDLKNELLYYIRLCDQSIHPRLKSDLIVSHDDLFEELFGYKGIIFKLESLFEESIHLFADSKPIPKQLLRLLKQATPKLNEEIQPIKGYTIQNYQLSSQVNQLKDILEIPITTLFTHMASMIEPIDPSTKGRVLTNLLRELQQNYNDLIWAYMNHRIFVYHIKIRYIIEFIGVFHHLLTGDNERSSLFIHHQNVLKKDLVDQIIKVKNTDANLIKKFFLKYEEDLNSMKNIYLSKVTTVDKNKLKLLIKHTNGWLLDLSSNKIKAPKTIELIKKAIKQMDQNLLEDVIHAMYEESCHYCHVTAYSTKQGLLSNDKTSQFTSLNQLIQELLFNLIKQYPTHEISSFFDEKNGNNLSIKNINFFLNFEHTFDRI